MVDILQGEAGDRTLHITKQFTTFAQELPRRVIMRELEEEIEQ